MDWQTFFRHQMEVWPETCTRYKALDKVRTRFVEMDGFSIRIDFNPERERSTAAKVDTASISKRACFLCRDNRPAKQFAMTAGEVSPELQKYDFLVNPFPILHPHFTIVSKEHRPQDIPDRAMLAAARLYPDLIFFFNGAGAGASAPDHSHFQAVKRFSLRPPVHYELFPDAEAVWSEIEYRCLQANGLFNLFVYRYNNHTEALFIPRRSHRPRCFPRIMVSPGALDVAGHIITIRESDFQILNASIIREIYADTCF